MVSGERRTRSMEMHRRHRTLRGFHQADLVLEALARPEGLGRAGTTTDTLAWYAESA
jgi:hypothetical protein